MKRFNVIVISFISFVIFSCSKKDEVVMPQNEMEAQSETKQSQHQNVPHFN
jgi:hypothetical protein